MEHTYLTWSNKIRIFAIVIALSLSLAHIANAQDDYMDPDKKKLQASYQGGNFYKVKTYKQPQKYETPKNVILMIGDGMGISHIYAAMTANGGNLFLQNFKYSGFAKTHSSDNYITDSAASGTAMATGVKTYNGAIGVNDNEVPIKNIREMAEEKGMSTGLVSTSAITHATPASFIAHQPFRDMYEEIAADFLHSGIDVFIGGGWDHFEKRKDSLNYSDSLRLYGYSVLYSINDIKKAKTDKLAGFTAPGHNVPLPKRGEMLVPATEIAIKALSKNDKGFFLMVEGSQIDWGGHGNNTAYIVMETLDFDRAIGEALKFASANKETLIIVTADHETGGMSINNGNIKTGYIESFYTTGGHTGVPVPVFAFGPGAEHFTGIIDNTDIPKIIMKLLGF
jgi:alkaline phosphatase